MSLEESKAKYIERMIQEGNVIVYPKPNELQLDIDTDEQLHNFVEMFAVLQENIGKLPYSSKPSNNREEGKHITITMPHDLTVPERIAYQAALGSDPKREMLSMVRYYNGDTQPTMFTERKK